MRRGLPLRAVYKLLRAYYELLRIIMICYPYLRQLRRSITDEYETRILITGVLQHICGMTLILTIPLIKKYNQLNMSTYWLRAIYVWLRISTND